jgi:diguanylate cyclase (GGDEF)-like protein/PAS domain S-box-containing protein
MVEGLYGEKNKYLTIFEESPNPIILLDSKSKIEYANFAANKLFFNQEVSEKDYNSENKKYDLPDWIKDDLKSFIKNGNTEFSIEKKFDRLGCFYIKFKKIVDANDKYNGTIVFFNDITNQKLDEIELYNSHEFFLNTFDVSPALMWMSDNSAKCFYFNKSWMNFTGRTIDQELGEGWAEGIHPDDYDYCMSTYTEAFNKRVPFEMAYRLRRHDGEYRWIFDIGRPFKDVDGNFAGYIGTCLDITTHKHIDKITKRYQALAEYTRDIILFISKDGDIVEANSAAVKAYGYSRKELLSLTLYDLRTPKEKHLVSDRLSEVLSKDIQVETLAYCKDGSTFPIEVSAQCIIIDNEPVILSIARDITERKKNEEWVKYLAYHDSLTGLPNRDLLNDKLKQAILRSKHNNNIIGVMFIDLDRFKVINDTLGHNIGDLLLCQASRRLEECVRKGDIISRFGGDEFIIMLEDISRKDLTKIAQRLINKFNKPFNINGHEIFTSLSIGISLYPADGDNAEELIMNADSAMYLVKEQGKNNYKFSSSEINTVVFQKANLENDLRKALKNDEFVLNYQPQVELDSGKVVSMEALIRWQHPKVGLIPPGKFIPLAEEIGLIRSIGMWVLETACKQNKAWQDAGYPPMPVAVNISVKQFMHKDFVKLVYRVLQETGLEPEYLELEITESFAQNLKEAKSILKRLKAKGVKITVDDFGTGYSSLSVLKHLPFDNLKIDKSFIDEIAANPKAAALVETIINMGYNLNLKVIAEGIEHKRQASFLKRCRCPYGQGYFFSKPLPVGKINEMLKNAKSCFSKTVDI